MWFNKQVTSLPVYTLLLSFINNILKESSGPTNTFRTLGYFYETSAGDVAQVVSRNLSNQYRLSLTVNLDNDILKLENTYVIGNNYLNLIFIENVGNLVKINNLINVTQFSGFDAKTLLVVKEKPETNQMIAYAMKLLNEHHIINAALLFWGKGIELYAYDPFLNGTHSLTKIYEKNETLVDKWQHKPVLSKIFWNKAQNMQRNNVTVFMYHDPPKIIRLPNKLRLGSLFFYGGRDGYTTSLLSQKLNSFFVYKTFKSEDIVRLTSDANASVVRDSNGKVIEPNSVKSFNVDYLEKSSVNTTSLNISVDLVMMSRFHTIHDIGSYEHLYPHEFDNICIVIPNSRRKLAFSLDKIFSSLPSKLIPVILFLFIIIWKLIQNTMKPKPSGVLQITMRVLGIYLGCSYNHRVYFRSEKILLITIYLFTLTTVVTITGIIYQHLIILEYTSNIDYLYELEIKNYQLLISGEIGMNFNEWSNSLSKGLRDKVKIVDEDKLINFMLNKNTSYAYALSKTKAKLILDKVEMWENGENIFYIMKEHLVPSVMSFQIKDNSPIKGYVDLCLRHFNEHGFMEIFIRWTNFYLYTMHTSKIMVPDHGKTETEIAPLGLKNIESLLILYVSGIILCFLIFVIEHMFIKLKVSHSSQIKSL